MEPPVKPEGDDVFADTARMGPHGTNDTGEVLGRPRRFAAVAERWGLLKR